MVWQAEPRSFVGRGFFIGLRGVLLPVAVSIGIEGSIALHKKLETNVVLGS